MELYEEGPLRDTINNWKYDSERLMEDLYFNLITLDEYKQKDKELTSQYQQNLLNLTK